ncbi:tyrosine-type recombinase/integrase [Vibrio rumoiensis]|uniref:Tyr recombinase domain-containing protein n=1 Tax=Vibrio rumoiensis 1S-45 TaxID=1188252 RepID=A0A1E5E4F3_9VIBR|nr:tyrosine-type recombinase/integrase [Vibrio rumoiensis]OEF27633.1 hypothetical protein A1QC_06265 [Vibrio rumoiensis 1S-45]
MKKVIPLISDLSELKSSQAKFSHLIMYDDLNKLTAYQYAHNSLLSMVNDWNRFVQFCQSKHVSALPASVTAIRLFLEKESAQRKYSTLRRYSLTISLLHRLHGLPDPVNHRQIHFTLSALRNLKKGDATQATPFSAEHLSALTKILVSSESIKDLRDLIIYYLMFECILKRGQLRMLSINALDTTNPHAIKLSIGDQTYSLSEIASSLITRWLCIINRDTGFLLCRIDKHENIGNDALNDSSIYRVFRRASERLGLPQHLHFSGQSTRVGATQELFKQGYNLRQIQEVGRWVSPVMPAQYLGQHQLSESEQLVFKRIKSWD